MRDVEPMRAGVVAALNKPFGHERNSTVRIPPGLEGYLLQITQTLPGSSGLCLRGGGQQVTTKYPPLQNMTSAPRGAGSPLQHLTSASGGGPPPPRI
eukprot:1162300-Prorocentrum_minimum.AAC.1